MYALRRARGFSPSRSTGNASRLKGSNDADGGACRQNFLHRNSLLSGLFFEV